jgi:hypothetical protein
MNRKIEELLDNIRKLEKELKDEMQRIRIDTYEIRDHVVHFRETVRERHRTQMLGLYRYLRHARLKHVLTAPIIWLCIFPALFLDLVVSVYQLICFPVYGIPKVRRRDHIVIDHQYLAYLNIIEKLNCMFCSYFNGLLSYVSEIASRTEQYWCPIKHASQLKKVHGRYYKFSEFGDSDTYRQKLETIRRDFSDLEDKQG